MKNKLYIQYGIKGEEFGVRYTADYRPDRCTKEDVLNALRASLKSYEGITAKSAQITAPGMFTLTWNRIDE